MDMADHEGDRGGGEIRSLIVVPVMDPDGHVIGTLSVDCTSRVLKDFSDEEREALVVFSGQIGSLGYKTKPSPGVNR